MELPKLWQELENFKKTSREIREKNGTFMWIFSFILAFIAVSLRHLWKFFVLAALFILFGVVLGILVKIVVLVVNSNVFDLW